MAKPITIKITGDTAGLKGAVGDADSQMKKLAGFGKVAGAGLAAGLAVGVAAAFTIGQEFEKMRNVIIQGTGASGAALDDLTEQAEDLMTRVPLSAEEAGAAIADLNTLWGLTGDAAEDAAVNYENFARVNGTDMGDAIANTHDIMTLFNMDIAETDELLGDLTRIAQRTGVPIEDLMAAVENGAPALEAMNLTAEEGAAFFGRLAEAGIDVADSQKILDRVMLDAADTGQTVEEVFAGLGDMTEDQRLAWLEQTVGARNATTALAAYNSGALNLENLDEFVGDGTGLLEDQGAALLTLGDKFTILKNKAMVALRPIVDAIMDGFVWALDNVLPALESVWGFLRDNKPILIGVATVIGVGLVGALAAMAVAAWAALAPVLVMAAPFIAVGVAIAAVTAGFVWLYENVDIFREAVDKAIKFVTQTAWPAIKRFGEIVWDLANVWLDVQLFIVGKIADIVGAVIGIPGKIVEVASDFLDAGKELGGAILDGLLGALTATGGFVSDIGSAVWDAVKGAINTLIDSLNNGIPNSISLGFGPSIDLPDNPVPRLAMGGLGSGVTMVGERGPELVNLPNGSRVTPNHRSGGAGGNITVNVTSPSDPFKIAREVSWAMRTSGR